MVGAIQLGISLARLGDLTRYISHSVIVGFTAGASLLLVLDQMKNLLGLKAMGTAHDHFLYRFWLTMTGGGAVHAPTLVVGLGSIVFVLVLRWIKRRLRWELLPEFLIAVLVAAAATRRARARPAGVAVVGDIPTVAAGVPLRYSTPSSFVSTPTSALAICAPRTARSHLHGQSHRRP
jgi:SulP family sulfate permease